MNAYNDPEYQRNRKIILTGKPNCAICGKPGADTVDHIRPIDADGDHDLTNLRPAHRSCNSRLGAIHVNRKTASRIAQRNATIFGSPTQLTPTPNQQNTWDDLGFCQVSTDSAMPATIGRAEPRLETIIPEGLSAGPLLIEFAASFLGLTLMPWQERVLTAMLTTDQSGQLVFREALISTARQQGKSEALKALCAYWLVVVARERGKPQNVLLVANKLDRSMKMFRDLAELLEEKSGAKVRWSNGMSSVTMPDKSTFKLAAAKDNHHGSTNDLVCVDEIWNVQPAVIYDALRPSMIARPNPMLAMWSTAGDQSSSLMLQLREQAISAIDAGRTGRLYFAEWSPPPEIDPGNWRACAPWANPALGETITWPALEAAYDGPDRQSFMRAHLNLWIAAAQGWLPHGAWAQLQTNDPMPQAGILAIDSSVDGLRYVGVRAATQLDGKVRVATEFVVESETEMWAKIQTAAENDPTLELAITPGLELHTPLPLRRRTTTVGYGELQKWTVLVRAMILEQRITHNGEINLAEHLNRAVMVKSQNAVALSSQKSPGPIELARCTVWAAALASRPATKQRPAIAVG